ncbi:MAG: LacI family DNA-binding transcriptional regulator [Bacteroidia bacterium]
MSKRQITLSDLAKELGISTATVSRALKDYPDISNKTKQRVLELAKKLNYRPNTMAAGLRKQESRIIGVIIPEIVNHFFSSVIKGIMQVAYDSDYRVMICQSDESYEKEVTDANALFNSRVDGLLVSLAHHTQSLDHFEEFINAGVPIVFFDKIPQHASMAETSKVAVDDYQGAYQMVSHLISQGAKRIAHFRGPMMAYTSRNRYNGYIQAHKDHGLELDESLIFDTHNITMEEGRQFANEVMQNPTGCDAIFCITDTVAIGAIDALKANGVKVPEDIMVAGFSDWQVSAIIDPPLSSVAQPSLEMGKQAIALLLHEINAQKNNLTVEYQFIELPTELKIRQSSLRTKVV